MAWCRQATIHYLSQCWARSLSPYYVIRPQWVNGARILNSFNKQKLLNQTKQCVDTDRYHNQHYTLHLPLWLYVNQFFPNMHNWYIATETRWRPFCRWHVKRHFIEWKCQNSYSNSIKYHWNMFPISKPREASIIPRNDLVRNILRAISWPNCGLV